MSNAFPKLLAAAALLMLPATNASATWIINVPNEAPIPNDLDLTFDSGQCKDIHIRSLGAGAKTVPSGPGYTVKANCVGNILKIDFNGKNGTLGNIDRFTFPQIVETGSPKHLNYKWGSNVIHTAYWTYNDDPRKDEQGNRIYEWANGKYALLFVPEPATWAMLILGFGLVGTVLRRQRSAITRS